jgi:hypothetical protein
MPTDTVWACAYCPSPRRGCRTLPGRPRPRTRRRRQPRPSGTQPAVLLTGSSSSPSACRRHGHAGTSLGMRVWLTTGTERAHITTHSEARAPRQIGISEGAGLVKWLLGARALGGVDGGVSWWARGRANKPAGSRWSARSRRRGRTTLTSAHARGRRRSGFSCQLASRTRGPHRVPSVGEGGQARLPRRLFAHSVWANGAVRPRPSRARSHLSVSPLAREPCRSTSSPEGRVRGSHAAMGLR